MTKKIRKNELSEDELDCVTGGASNEEEEANLLRAATSVRISPVATASATNKVLPKSRPGTAIAAQPAQLAQKQPKPIDGVRTTNVGNRVKGHKS